MKILNHLTDKAVAELTSLTAPLNNILFPSVEDAQTGFKAKGRAYFEDKDKRWQFWSPCIGKDPDVRISKIKNPLTRTDGFVIQDVNPAATVEEATRRADAFKTKPSAIGIGLFDSLPLYLFLYPAPVTIDYAGFVAAVKGIAEANGLTPTKESFTPSTYWTHSYNFVTTEARLSEVPQPSQSSGPAAPSREELEAGAKALASQMWHESTTNTYWFPDSSGVIRKRAEIHAKTEFVTIGLNSTGRKSISPADRWLKWVRDHNAVDGVVEAPFRPIGPFHYAGRTILNRSQLTPIKPAPAVTARPDPVTNPCATPWERFCAFQDALFGQEQRPYVDALVCRAYLSLLDNRESFKQAAIISGPANAGKTLWVHNVVVPLLGGRCGNLKGYLSGNGAFTEHLFSSPIGILDDQAHEDKDKARFTSQLKNLISSRHQEFHAKFMPEQGITWQGAVWILCNLDPDSFTSSLPNFGMSILDKIHLFKALTPETFDFKNIAADIAQALPTYARYLQENEATILAAVIPRGPAVKYGIQPFHHRDLLNTSRMTETTTAIHEILEQLRDNYPHAFTDLCRLTATGVIHRIQRIEGMENAMKAFTPKQVGESLSNLSKVYDWIVVHDRVGSNSNRYTINHPQSPKKPVIIAQPPTPSPQINMDEDQPF